MKINRRAALAGITATAASSIAGPAFADEEPSFDVSPVVWLPDALGSNNPSGYKYQACAINMPNSNDTWMRLYHTGQETNAFNGDRIGLADSFDGGNTWISNPWVLAPRNGADGDSGDDALLGGPTVIRANGLWWMAYEGYGKWLVALRLVDNGNDRWMTSAMAETANPPGATSTVVGCAPVTPLEGTLPVYLVETTYNSLTGPKKNTFITKNKTPPNGFTGPWVLKFGGHPLFYAYQTGGQNMLHVETHWNGINSDTYTVVGGQPQPIQGDLPVEGIGYIVQDVSQPAADDRTEYALLNRIMLASSSDGLNWTRCDAGGPGKCALEPAESLVARMPDDPSSTVDLKRSYGSGVPVWWIRDGFVEILFTDGTVAADGVGPFYSGQGPDTQMWYTRIAVSGIGNSAAWAVASANRLRTTIGGEASLNGNGYNLSDVKWSPQDQRYFGFSPANGNEVAMYYSEVNPTPNSPPAFTRIPKDYILPGRAGSVYDVCVMGNEKGNVIAVSSGFVGNAFHIFPTFVPGSNVFESAIGHGVFFTAEPSP